MFPWEEILQNSHEDQGEGVRIRREATPDQLHVLNVTLSLLEFLTSLPLINLRRACI